MAASAAGSLSDILFDASPMATLIVDAEGRYVGANNAACALLGAPREALLAAKVGDFAAPDDADAVRAAFAGLRQRPQGPGGDMWVRRADGVAARVELCGAADVGDGKTAFFVRDVTQLRRAEEARSRMEGETRTALADSLEIVKTLNTVGTTLAAELNLERLVQMVTDAATRLSRAQFGAFFYNVIKGGESYMLYSLSGVPRETFAGFPMPRATAVFRPTFMGDGVVRSGDIRRDPRYGLSAPHHGMPPGHLPVVSYLAVPVVSRSGEVLGGLFFGHGEPGIFTEREEQIVQGLAAHAAVAIDNARLFSKAEEAVRTREDFLSIASHELRTPLTPLKLKLQGLRRAMDSSTSLEAARERVRGILDACMQQINRLTRLVDYLLDVARLTGQRFSVQPEPMDVAELLRDVADRCRPAAAQVGSALNVDAPEQLLGRFDRLRLDQAVLNLVTNAIKYAPGAPICLQARRRADELWVTVSDAGPGIPLQDQDRIFERFERSGDGAVSG
ncbi:MAG TPA: GAF domain-containing protein, partial [Myxococcota bacterium]|nr:GAF domain-containing protein [Myxococcota bacterium]